MYKVVNSKGVLITTSNREVAMLAATKYRWVMKHNEAMKFVKAHQYNFEKFRKELHKPNVLYKELVVRLITQIDEVPGENVILGYN